MTTNFFNKISAFFINYFSLSGQLVSQEEAERNIREGVSFKGTNILILILAIFVASLGLNTNSTAVIIGAMLISPLMGPIIGIGLGVIMAAGFSVIAASIYFLISPVNEQHSELLARTSPTIYDVLIAFFGGGAGIIALGSTNKGNVIPGVAIATTHAAAVYCRIRSGHTAVQLFFRSLLPLRHQFDIHSVRHFHRSKTHEVQGRDRRRRHPRTEGEKNRLLSGDTHDAAEHLSHIQHAEDKQIQR